MAIVPCAICGRGQRRFPCPRYRRRRIADGHAQCHHHQRRPILSATPATLRNLTLNGNVGQVTVPPGTYGTFTVNGGSGLVLGVAGGLQAVNYNLQNLNLNGNSTLKMVGPVVLTVANGFTANGTVGASNNPAWLQLQVASGGFTLNGGCTVYGLVLAPNGTVSSTAIPRWLALRPATSSY